MQNKTCLDHLNKTQWRIFHVESPKYLILNRMSFGSSFNGLLLHCVNDESANGILFLFYGSTCGGMHIAGNFGEKSTTYKILRYGYYWPIIV